MNDSNVFLFFRRIFFLILILFCTKSFAVELMIDVDSFDNFSETQFWKTDVYGPKQIADFFQNCKKYGVTMVYWRSHNQTAAYWSKLNYSLADEHSSLSRPDSRHRSGGYAAKVGTDKRNGGIFQDVPAQAGKKYTLRAWISAANENTASLQVIDEKSGKVIAAGKDISNTGDSFVETELSFMADGPSRVGVFGKCPKDMSIFVVDDVSLLSEDGIELIKNGRMEQIDRLFPNEWSTDANFVVINGDPAESAEGKRQLAKSPEIKIYWGFWRSPKLKRLANNRIKTLKLYDPLAVAVKEAHANGIKIYAWIDPLDDGRKIYPTCEGWWVSKFHEQHPEYRLVDQKGSRRWGMLCFGYDEVRKYKSELVKELLAYGVDGIYLKTAFQHNLIWDGKSYTYAQYAYNDVTLKEYDRRWGKPANGKYDLEKLKIINGDFFFEWVKDVSRIIRENGKKLAYSARPSKTLENMLGEWLVDWEKMIDEKIIDEFLIEPRHMGSHNGYFASIDRHFHIAEKCRKAGVKLGFDFYLNGLAEQRFLPRPKNTHDYFVDALTEIAHWPIDFIGIYEGMYVDGHNYWADIEKVNTRIKAIKTNEKLTPSSAQTKPNGMNVALKANGAASYEILKNAKRDTSRVIDGFLDDESSIMIHPNSQVIVKFAKPEKIAEIRIYPGYISYAANPSGECGIRQYILEGLSENKWILLCAPVTAAPSVNETVKMSFTDFHYAHKIESANSLDAIRLTVIQSSDTGCRISSPKESVVPENERVIYLRELEAYPVGHTPKD